MDPAFIVIIFILIVFGWFYLWTDDAIEAVKATLFYLGIGVVIGIISHFKECWTVFKNICLSVAGWLYDVLIALLGSYDMILPAIGLGVVLYYVKRK